MLADLQTKVAGHAVDTAGKERNLFGCHARGGEASTCEATIQCMAMGRIVTDMGRGKGGWRPGPGTHVALPEQRGQLPQLVLVQLSGNHDVKGLEEAGIVVHQLQQFLNPRLSEDGGPAVPSNAAGAMLASCSAPGPRNRRERQG